MPAPSENVTSFQAEAYSPVEFVAESAPAPSESVVSWQAEISPPVELRSGTAPILSEDATPSQFGASIQFDSVAEAASEISQRSMATSANVEIPTEQENATETNSPDHSSAAVFSETVSNQTPPLVVAPTAATEFAAFNSESINEEANSRWAIFRAKTVGWIKRTFDKLMALVGARS
jgi:hypothetical protein